MSVGRDALRHLVVLMMENRSFDHMLGGLGNAIPGLDGVPPGWSNPAPNGTPVLAQPLADYRGQLDPDPDHHFAAVNKQIFNGDPNQQPMQGFVNSYWDQQHSIGQASKIMYYFAPDKLPILSTLAKNFLVFNKWFSSIPGPTLCNRAFAHYGTSFGNVAMEMFYLGKGKSIYERLNDAGFKAKLYYFDPASSTMEVANILRNEPGVFATYQDFLNDCKSGTLPDYCFIEPNYSDHPSPNGTMTLASDQHPDHHVKEGENFIASIFNAIRNNASLWKSTALLVTYDEHGGIFDHVPPPACTPDGFADGSATGTGQPFHFDRLGVRVPAILISPWVDKGVDNRVFEHASIPATATEFLMGSFDDRTDREKAAQTFLDLVNRDVMRTDV